MTNILIIYSKSKVVRAKLVAIFWLKEFVALAGRSMLPFASGILMATLPNINLSEEETKLLAKDTAKGLVQLY